MKKKMKSIEINRKSDGRFTYKSPTFDCADLSECELMVLLGATFGATITDRRFRNCYWEIDITKISY